MRLSSLLLHAAVVGWLGLVPPVRALPPAPPPPVTVEGPEAPAVEEEGEFEAMRFWTLEAAEVVSSATVTTWTEDAENGAGHVTDGTAASYDLFQQERVAQGEFAFHLAHPDFADSWFVLNVVLHVQTDTKLFFQSRLQWATSNQVAKVQVSHDGGVTWPETIFSQSGTGAEGEGAFSLREVDLGAAYSGQQIMIRFLYDFTGGSAYTQTGIHLGWLIDDIQIGPAFAKTFWSIGNPTATETIYLEYINRARADALAEATRLRALTDPQIMAAYNEFGITPQNISAQFQWNVTHCMARFSQPLAFQAQLMETAQKHSQDMHLNEFQAHDSSSNPIAPFQPGDTFGDRLDRVGYSGGAGENVFAYSRSVEYGHAGFEVDWGTVTDAASPCYNPQFAGQGMQNPAGHRINSHQEGFNEAGIGVVNGTNGSVGPQIVTQDLGSTFGVSYITGVIYEDSDSNGFYSAASDASHEGRGGVRIDLEGSPYYTISTASGAYALPVVEGGTYTVTFSAEGMHSFTIDVVVNGQNAKLDHHPVDFTRYELWAAQHGVTGGPLEDDDHDGIINRVESAILGMDPTAPDAWKLPAFVDAEDGGMRFTVPKHPQATDLHFEVLVSTDLIEWHPAGDLPGTTVAIDNAEELDVKADLSLPSLFGRLRITPLE